MYQIIFVKKEEKATPLAILINLLLSHIDTLRYKNMRSSIKSSKEYILIK